MPARRIAALATAAAAAAITLSACGAQGPATTKNYVTPGPPLPSLNTPSNSGSASPSP